MAFRRDGLQYGGKRLRLAPPGSGITGSVSAFDVDLGNDHARMTDLHLRLDRPDLQATVTVPRISSAGFDPHFVDRTNVIALGHMVIDSPVIDVQLFAGAEEPPRGQGSAKPTGRSPYRGVHARSIAVQNGTIGVGLDQSGSRMEATLMDLSSQLNDLDLRVNMTDPPLRTGPISVKVGRIDLVSGNHADSTLTTLDLSIDMDATTQDEHGALRLDGLRFGAEAISAPLPGGMHLSTGRIDYVPQLEQLSVRTINYAPIAAQANFASEREYRADALVLEVDQLLASGLDLPTVIATKKFDLRHLSLEGVRVNDLRDHRLPIAPYRYKPMLHRTIADLEQHVRIDTVQVRNAQVEYGEIQPVDTARIRLTTVQASILNICSGMARCNQPMTLRAAGLVQDEGEFEVMMDFEVDHPKDLFTYRFSLGPMDLTALDGMLAPAAHITIESGRLDTLYLVAEANDEVAIGNMRMFYRKLHLRLLDRHNEYNGVFPVVESWVANSLVRTNHSERHRTRPAAIYFERLKDRSIFNYVIKQSLSGAGGNVRLPDHKGKVRRLEDEELKYRLEQDTGTP